MNNRLGKGGYGGGAGKKSDSFHSDGADGSRGSSAFLTDSAGGALWNSAQQEKDLPAENLKGRKFVSLTWDRDGKKLVLRFEGDRILWIAPARKGEEDEELVVDTDGMLILGEGPSGDELIDHTEGYFGPAPGSTWHK